MKITGYFNMIIVIELIILVVYINLYFFIIFEFIKNYYDFIKNCCCY